MHSSDSVAREATFEHGHSREEKDRQSMVFVLVRLGT